MGWEDDNLEEGATQGPGVAAHDAFQQTPIDPHALQDSVEAAIVDTGTSGLGPGTAPTGEVPGVKATNVPSPTRIEEYKSGVDPAVTFTYILGPDGKLYGPKEAGRVPKRCRRHVRIKATHGRYGWQVTATVVETGRIGMSGAPTDAVSDAERQRVRDKEQRATAADQAATTPEGHRQARDDWSRAEQSVPDRERLFLSGDPRVCVRQALLDLQNHHCLDPVPCVSPHRRRRMAAAVAVVVAAIVGIGFAVLDRGGSTGTSAAPAPTAAPGTAAAPTTTPSTTATPAAPNHPPTLGPIRATFQRPTTTYDVAAEDPDGDALTFTWTKSQATSCGRFFFHANEADWVHPDASFTPPGDCPDEPVHAAVITVTVDDGHGNRVSASYPGGSAPGEGPPPAG